MKITIASSVFMATFLDNATATAFKAKLPLTINMKDLNRNVFFDFDFNMTQMLQIQEPSKMVI